MRSLGFVACVILFGGVGLAAEFPPLVGHTNIYKSLSAQLSKVARIIDVSITNNFHLPPASYVYIRVKGVYNDSRNPMDLLVEPIGEQPIDGVKHQLLVLKNVNPSRSVLDFRTTPRPELSTPRSFEFEFKLVADSHTKAQQWDLAIPYYPSPAAGEKNSLGRKLDYYKVQVALDPKKGYSIKHGH